MKTNKTTNRLTEIQKPQTNAELIAEILFGLKFEKKTQPHQAGWFEFRNLRDGAFIRACLDDELQVMAFTKNSVLMSKVCFSLPVAPEVALATLKATIKQLRVR